MLNKSFSILPISIFSLLILISALFIPIITNSNSNIDFNGTYKPTNLLKVETITLSNNFEWPTPGYKTITCKFGYRVAPTTGASTYHGGIDIAAPTGAKLVATFSGKIIFIGFSGANGYSIIIENGDYTATYGHVSPNYIVKKNQHIVKGEVIGMVGPKNVYNVPNNPYRDSFGKPTNGATTRTTPSLCNKKRRCCCEPS